MKRWYDNWDAISLIFKFSADVRTIIYTTNAIESLNSTYRRLNSQRGVFPKDSTLLKALYLSTFEATEKWTMPVRNCGKVYSELATTYLHAKGLRYRKHVAELPGKPYLVFRKHKTVVFINGCFWHMHEGCRYARFPATNDSYWRPKLLRNVERDKANREKLETMGYRVIVVWECELKSDREARLERLYQEITKLPANNSYLFDD